MTDTCQFENADQQVEIALRKADERFRAAMSAVQGVLWTNDAAGRMVGEQPGWAALTGQSSAEYEGYGWAEAVHPDDAQPTIDAWNESVARRETFVFEHRVRRHDGAWRLFSIRAVPLLDPDGSLCEWVGVHTDITGRKEAESRLRESEEQLRLADTLAIIWMKAAVKVGHRHRNVGRNAEHCLGPCMPKEPVSDEVGVP